MWNCKVVCGIGFDARTQFSLSNGKGGDKSAISFELDDISSMLADDIKNVISALEEDGLDDATIR